MVQIDLRRVILYITYLASIQLFHAFLQYIIPRCCGRPGALLHEAEGRVQ